MKHTTSLFFFILFFSSFTSLYAQSNYQPGYLIVQGDTVKGEINYRNWKKNPRHITFRKNGEESSRSYSAKDIDRFFVNGEFYTGAVVSVEASPYRESELNQLPDLHFRTDTVFLRDVISGKKNLYVYEDKDSKIHYLIGDRNHIQTLVYKQYLVTEKGARYTRANRSFIGQLSEYLQDCPSIKDGIKNLSYQRGSLVKIFDRYYKCINSEINVKAKDEKMIFKLGVTAGIVVDNIGGLTFTPIDKAFATDPLFSTSVSSSASFCAGPSLDMIFPRLQQKWSLHNELLFGTFTLHGETPATPYYLAERYDYKSSLLRLNSLLRYRILLKQVTPFVNIGITVAKTLSESVNEAKIGQSTIAPYFLPASHLDAAVLAGAGVSGKRISFEIRYEYGTKMSTASGLGRTTIPRLYFLLGYRF